MVFDVSHQQISFVLNLIVQLAVKEGKAGLVLQHSDVFAVFNQVLQLPLQDSLFQVLCEFQVDSKPFEFENDELVVSAELLKGQEGVFADFDDNGFDVPTMQKAWSFGRG